MFACRPLVSARIVAVARPFSSFSAAFSAFSLLSPSCSCCYSLSSPINQPANQSIREGHTTPPPPEIPSISPAAPNHSSLNTHHLHPLSRSRPPQPPADASHSQTHLVRWAAVLGLASPNPPKSHPDGLSFSSSIICDNTGRSRRVTARPFSLSAATARLSRLLPHSHSPQSAFQRYLEGMLFAMLFSSAPAINCNPPR